MSYDSKALQYDKEHIYVVEVELDYCSNTFGSSPCTASGSGDAKCFNTFGSCQDLPNYKGGVTADTGSETISRVFDYYSRSTGSFIDDGFEVGDKVTFFPTRSEALSKATVTTVEATKLYTSGLLFYYTGIGGERIATIGTKTYRFCEERSPHPIGINAIPSLNSVSIAPAKINVSGGMGERSSVSLSFKDNPHSDIDIDQYVSERTWNASERGLFWTKLRARNPNYQFRPLRVLSGYLEDNAFIESNFKTRNYIIDKLDVSGGKANISGKDPLKRASAKKAQVPKPNTGVLVSDISSTATTIFLTPSGVGSQEYETSGYVTIGGNEVCEFTRSGDLVTIVSGKRGDKGTTASAHSAGDTFQQCYVQNAEVNIITKDLLTNFANIDPSFINDAEWQTEVDTYLNGLLDGIITKPTDVFKVIIELAEAKPFSIYWDELNQQIKFKAIKAPPTSANVIDMDSGIVANSFKTKDLIDLRFSTVNYTFGQIDPTIDIKELSNYTQTVTRIDSDSIAKYDTNQIKNIVSRWINSGNKPAAENSAQLFGRRFANIPREASFSLEAKDSSLNIGDTIAINHRDIVDETGAPTDTIFQIITAKEEKVFKYTGVEYVYGPTVASDNDIDVDTILFSINEQNVDLRARYETNIGTPTAATEAVFEVQSRVIIGSSSTATPAMVTGSWPAGATVTLINNGHIVGAGGNGGTLTIGLNGGDAISLGYALTIQNFGVIGGGGGGGWGIDTGFGIISGGGGAGNKVGLAGGPTATDGTLESGGLGLTYGGDLGEDSADFATVAGASGGKAIDLNGFTETIDTLDDYRGEIS